MSQEKPEGWVEPVNESLLRPAAFFGATPRGFVVSCYVVGGLLLFIGAMHKSWEMAVTIVVALCAVQITTASLTYLEPNWFGLLSEWLKSPQSKVDP